MSRVPSPVRVGTYSFSGVADTRAVLDTEVRYASPTGLVSSSETTGLVSIFLL